MGPLSFIKERGAGKKKNLNLHFGLMLTIKIPQKDKKKNYRPPGYKYGKGGFHIQYGHVT